MKTKITASITILFFSVLILLYSCKGQDSNDNSKEKKRSSTIGKIVSELEHGILVIFQDKNDHYWFGGGEQGVYKYDGINLVLFTVKDGLCSHSVLGIQEDKVGNIYFDTTEGVSKFDGQKFTTLEVVKGKNKWKLETDDLWFRMGWGKNGPYRYDGKSLYQLEFPKSDMADEFYAKYPNVDYNPYGIYNLYQDSKGAVWFGTSSLGVCRYDGNSLSWLYEKQLTKTSGGGDFGIRSIIEDKDGYFWFCNTRYRYEISPDYSEKNGTNYINYKRENGTVKSTGEDKNDVPYFMSIAEDDSGDLWMVTYDDGVWRNDEKKLIHYPIKDGETDILLFSIYKDRTGALWLGAHNAAPYKFNGEAFEKFDPNPDQK